MRPSPTSLAEAVRRYNADGGGEEGAFAVLLDEFLDAFYTQESAEQRQITIEEGPPRIGTERLDAYVGAVGEHLARRRGLRIPSWTDQPWREVAEPWFVGMMGEDLSGLLLVESPIAFRRRRIFAEAEPLRRARMPGHIVGEAKVSQPAPLQQP
jgi:hypothetical protein